MQCVNAVDGKCVFPLSDFRSRIYPEILNAGIEILTRDKRDGGHGYCDDYAKKANDYLCMLQLVGELKEKILRADECFKNSPELLKVYNDIIQDGVIEINGIRWPIHTLIISTTNEALRNL